MSDYQISKKLSKKEADNCALFETIKVQINSPKRFIKKNNKYFLSNVSKLVQLTRLIAKLQNKNKIKDFGMLLFRHLEIFNESSENVYVRVKSRKIGSEEFFCLKALESRKWKRFEGEYLIEIVFDDLKSKRYKMLADKIYTLTKEKQIVNVSSSSAVIDATEEMFGGKELVCYDTVRKDYIRKNIDYNEDAGNDNTINTIEYNNNSSEEHKQEEEFSYFNGIKPNYIPGHPFTDESFPPDRSSLKAVDPITGQGRIPHFVHAKKGLSAQSINFITFKRPRDAFKGQYYLFKDEICYEDVKQGQIGNCYLMSILAALGQRPDLIKAVFKSHTINPDGFYELFFYENGEKKIIFIDDNVVLMNSKYSDEFYFAKPNGEELWVMLIEKAYAKYEGGYSNILGGLMYPELEWLTGVKSGEIRADDPQCWKEIHIACQAGHVVVAGSLKGSGNHNKKSEKGISNSHDYSVLDAEEYSENNKSLKLVKLRNPWGYCEWKGDYCDNSPLWTPELKAFFGYNDAGDENDGEFFMPFEDFTKEFWNVVICPIDTRKSKD